MYDWYIYTLIWMYVYTDFKGDAYMIHRIEDTYSHSYSLPAIHSNRMLFPPESEWESLVYVPFFL